MPDYPIQLTRKKDGKLPPLKVGNFAWMLDGGRRIMFICPNSKGYCGVPVLPTENGWTWDGYEDAPTLTPSIMCHGCGWHGYITAGQFIHHSG